MKKLIVLIVLAAAAGFYSCSKSDNNTSDNKNKEIKGNEQNKTNQQTQQNNTQQNQNTSSSASYHVHNIGVAGGKNESVDFSWSENGAEKKLSDYKGKVVLLNFLATWCGHSKREMPDLSS